MATYFSFIVRIWRERSLTHPEIVKPGWQGEVEQIQTGEQWTFETLDEMLRFFRRRKEEMERAEGDTHPPLEP
jgi:hypothetical protein